MLVVGQVCAKVVINHAVGELPKWKQKGGSMAQEKIELVHIILLLRHIYEEMK